MHLLLLTLVVIIFNLFTISSASALTPTHTIVKRATKSNPALVPRTTVHLEGEAIWRTSSGGLFGLVRMSLDDSPGHKNNNQRDCLATGAVIANQTSCICTVTNAAIWNYIDCVASLIVDPDHVPKNRPHPAGIVARWRGRFFWRTRETKMKVQQPAEKADCLGSRRACDGLIFRDWRHEKDIYRCPDGSLGKRVNVGDDWRPQQNDGEL